MRNKHNVESPIQWQIKSGSCYFLCDNSLGVRPLAHFTRDNNTLNSATFSKFIEEGEWNINKVI